MRKIYQTPEDKLRQNRVAEYISEAWDCDFVAAEDLSYVDGKIIDRDGQVSALVEIKTRRNASTKYPTYMLSAYKWRNALQLANTHRVPFMLVVEFTDGIFATKMRSDYPTAAGGRLDRNDPMDIEDCIFIPMGDFRKI